MDCCVPTKVRARVRGQPDGHRADPCTTQIPSGNNPEYMQFGGQWIKYLRTGLIDIPHSQIRRLAWAHGC